MYDVYEKHTRRHYRGFAANPIRRLDREKDWVEPPDVVGGKIAFVVWPVGHTNYVRFRFSRSRISRNCRLVFSEELAQILADR